jgi:hypothetical protein
MKQFYVVAVIVFFSISSNAQQVQLPAHYYKLLEIGVNRIESRFAEHPEPTLALLEKGQPFGHFPHAIIIPAVLYAKKHPANKHYHEARMLELAKKLGALLVRENNSGTYSKRHDSDWDTYMWLEAYRLLKNDLDETTRELWAAAIKQNLDLLWPLLNKYKERPWYTPPFIITSPNHLSIYASALLLGGHVFNQQEWIKASSEVLHRFCTEEQAKDGYWGEHSQAGPTTGYDFITVTQISVYAEYSKDPAALKALERSLNFHKYYTYPDGTPVETINDRNRYWGVSVWGHFGYSHFPDGRRYARFLSSFYPLNGDTISYGGDMQSLGRIAQDAIYYHEGPSGHIPQDSVNYAHTMHVPAGIRKNGAWTVTYSGIIAPKVSLNNFFLDRQGNFSVFHYKKGLIITGANSKRQPQLATFTEYVRGDSLNMPVSSKLVLNNKMDKLSLAYNVFYATIEVPKPTTDKLSFDIRTVYKWGDADTRMNLQLVLKSGMELVTGSGKKITLGAEPVFLDSADVNGLITHNGWTMHVPASAKLYWPVYPFNPYADAPEKDIIKAVGRLTMQVPLKDNLFPFSIEVK